MGSRPGAASSSSSFVSIQALRAIAALLVFAEHAANTLVFEHKLEWFPHVPYGPFGVDLFFVISGFVMVYSSERLFGQPDAPIRFFARRLARIGPLYWATTAVFVWLVVPQASTKAVLGSIFFFPHIPWDAPVLFVGWTLVFEMFFYTVFAIALLAKGRFAAVAGASVFLILFVLLCAPPATASWGPPAGHSSAYLADPIVLEFVYGMAIALVYRAGIRLSIAATFSLIIVAFVWFAATALSLPRPYSCGIAAALIVAGASLTSIPRPKQGLIVTGVVFWGDASYSLYLTHILSFSLVAWCGAKLLVNPLDHVWGFVLAMLAVPLFIAAAAHLVFEKPMTRFFQKRIEDRSQVYVHRTGAMAIAPIKQS
jgi:exopolysaccharide production protein ExoZ